jgi:hypothetical protein
MNIRAQLSVSLRRWQVRSCIALAFVVALGLYIVRSPPAISDQQLFQREMIGSEDQHSGIMSEADFLRIRDLNDDLKRDCTMSDDDFNWLISRLSRKSTHPEIVAMRVISVLRELKEPKDAQKAKMREIAVEHMHDALLWNAKASKKLLAEAQ